MKTSQPKGGRPLLDRSLYRRSEAARYLEITRHLVDVAIRTGKLSTHTLGGEIYVTRASLERYRAVLIDEPETRARAA